MAAGKIVSVRGVVVDVDFPGGELPEIFEALHVNHDEGQLVLEVQQHLGGDRVRCRLQWVQPTVCPVASMLK